MRKVFRDYAEYNEEFLKGCRIAEVILTEDNGIVLELEREIEGGIIGIDMVYNPEPEEGETPFMISHEYIKHVY